MLKQTMEKARYFISLPRYGKERSLFGRRISLTEAVSARMANINVYHRGRTRNLTALAFLRHAMDLKALLVSRPRSSSPAGFPLAVSTLAVH